MTSEQHITLRLEEIEATLACHSILAVADQAGRRIRILPRSPERNMSIEHLWQLVQSAPSIEMSEQELLAEDYLERALRKASGLFALAG
jgi:hypothetical protein